MSTPYKPISWSPNEAITRAKLNQMTSNDQWMFENFPRIKYEAFGVKRTSAMKIATGIRSFSKSKYTMVFGRVYFGGFFSTGCRPVVVSTPLTRNGQRRLYTVNDGIGTNLHPDHRGFAIGLINNPINPKSKLGITYTTYVHWIAVGY